MLTCTALVNAAAIAPSTPRVYVIEDVHWIDEVSESMLAEFLAVVAQTRSLVLITYRPEYREPLSRISGAQMISLAPLERSRESCCGGGLRPYSSTPPIFRGCARRMPSRGR
jgi:predicted ATPase